MRVTTLTQPKAITMWDFSWLERRFPEAGYDDWDNALDGLVERGYDAVRIDAYPHLVSAGPEKDWRLLPIWTCNDWGSPSEIEVQVMPALLEFVRKCRDRGIAVGLSSWFREDTSAQRDLIGSPERHGEIWLSVLRRIDEAGLLDSLLYVDLCNEFPDPTWAPFYWLDGRENADWGTAAAREWMRRSIGLLRGEYPDLDYTFSFASHLFDRTEVNLRMLDFLEPHTWMTRDSEFYERIGYSYQKFTNEGYLRVAKQARPLYDHARDYWQERLKANIETIAEWSKKQQKRVVTTEAWAIVDYKDWPGLDWGWVKELNELAVGWASDTGRWAAICQSNFCGPQFRGNWKDVAYHRRITDRIRSGRISA